MSARNHLVDYLDRRRSTTLGATGSGAAGSNASAGSTSGVVGTHSLDGPEHTDATGTDRLLATIDHAGLMPALDGNAAHAVRGDGTIGPLTGSGSEEEFVEHDALGSAEDFDPDAGLSHTGTLDDDCTATITAPAGDGPLQMEWWITGDGDGHELTIDADGGTVIGDTPPASVDGETYRLVIDRIPGSTNDWIVNLVGGSSSVGALDDLSDVTITTPAENDTLRYRSGAWVNDNRRWEPVTANPGGGPEMVFDGDDLVMNWTEY